MDMARALARVLLAGAPQAVEAGARIQNPGVPPPQISDPRGNFWAELPGVTDKWGLYSGQPQADAANPAIVRPAPDSFSRMPTAPETDQRALLARMLARGI